MACLKIIQNYDCKGAQANKLESSGLVLGTNLIPFASAIPLYSTQDKRG